MPRKAVIYARFSSDRQTEMSIEAQVRACREYASNNDCTITGEYADEAISGTTNKRAAYQRLMRDAKNGKFDIILIHKYDRIARSLIEHVMLAQRLEEYGVELIAVAQAFDNSTKEGRLSTAIQWVLSQYYIENLSEETRKGLKETALRGLHNGGYPPFGYDVIDQKYVINVLEAGYVRRMFDCALHRTGYMELIKEMQENGITGKRGKPIKQAQINEILHNEKYTGVFLYTLEEEKSRKNRRTKPNAIRIEGAIPPIVTREVWEEVQRIMAERKQNAHNAYRCSGLVVCGNCGAKMHVYTSTRKGHTYQYYRCPNKCGNKSVRLDLVDQLADIVIRDTLSKANVDEITKSMNEYVSEESRMLAEFEETRAKKLAEKQAEYDTLFTNMTSATLPPEVTALIGDKLQDIKAEMDKIKAVKPIRSYTTKMIQDWLDSVMNADPNDLPKLLIERIEIKNDEAKVISTLASVVGQNGCGGVKPNPQLFFERFISRLFAL